MNKILVLDDDPDISSVITIILIKQGYACDYITDFNLLEKRIMNYMPDLLILDVSLGGADGRAISQKLKKNIEMNHIQIILLSANVDALNENIPFKADAFITKPFESIELIKTVERVLAKRPGLKYK
ncbi:MAG: hypothetical protein NVSMB45_06040 [Ginsengibacter sp.]